LGEDAALLGCEAMAVGWLEALSDLAIADRVRIVGLVDTNLAAADREAMSGILRYCNGM
jgi:hypothetical protein